VRISIKCHKTAKENNAKIIDFINEWGQRNWRKKVEVEKDKIWKQLLFNRKSYKDQIENLIKDGVNKEVGEELANVVAKIAELEKESEIDKVKNCKGC